MKYLLLACTSVCLVVLLACSKPGDLPSQPNNILTPPPTVPATIKIDTIITYTPTYYPWVGSQKVFNFPVLEGVSNPVIDVYYKTATQTTWKELPDGYPNSLIAWFFRNGKSITVVVRILTTEITVKIVVAW